MKIITILLLCGTSIMSAWAQNGHSLQGDDGLGHYFLISGSGLNAAANNYTLSPGGGQILTSGGLSGLAWMLGGNTGSAPNNYLGTLDNAPLNFVTGTGGPNTRMIIDADGEVGIGVTPTFGSVNPMLSVLSTRAADPSGWYDCIAYGHHFSPTTIWNSNVTMLDLFAQITNSSNNFNGSYFGVHSQVSVGQNFSGAFSDLEGGFFFSDFEGSGNVYQQIGTIGWTYNNSQSVASTNTYTIGTYGLVENSGKATILNAYGSYAAMYNVGSGTITNAYLFGANNPGTAGITNLYGLYVPQLTGATNINAIRYDHPTRPFVVDGNGNVGVDMDAQNGVALAVGTGSSGHPLVRIFKTNASNQYASVDYSPFGAITAANPRWGNGVMGLAFPNNNYSIWSFDGASDHNRVTIDPSGLVGINTWPTYPTLSSQFTVYNSGTTDPTAGNLNTIMNMDIIPSVPITHNATTLNVNAVVANSTQNFTAALAAERATAWAFGNYTGTLGYMQGGNFTVQFQAPSTLSGCDGVAGTVVNIGATPVITQARGVTGQIQNIGTCTVNTAWAHWAGFQSSGGGNIANAIMYGGANPATTGITNLYGVYIPQLTNATNIFAYYYAHPTTPFAVTGTGSVGVGTSSPSSLFSVGAGSKFQVDGNGDMVAIKNIAYSWPSAHVATLASGYLESDNSGALSWRGSVVVSAAITFNNTATNGVDNQTVTVNGAATGDVVSLGIPYGAMPAGMAWYQAWVSAANTVTIRFYNQTGANQAPSGTFSVKVTH